VVGVSPVDVKMTEPETVAFVAMRGPYAQIPEAMGRLYGWVAQQGLKPVEMPSVVYLTDPASGAESEAFWEVRAPVAGDPAPVAPDESGCGIRHDPSHLVASTMYRGPYEEIAPAYEDLQAWTTANGYAIVGPPREVYYSDPETTPVQEYLTEIRFPVAKD
jgi:effector-binding domain-containing protein